MCTADMYIVNQGLVWERVPPYHTILTLIDSGKNSCLTLSLSHKILDLTKLKAFADDKINVAKMMIPVFDRLENIVGKGENAGYQHFLLFLHCFQKVSFFGSLKSGFCGKELTHSHTTTPFDAPWKQAF